MKEEGGGGEEKIREEKCEGSEKGGARVHSVYTWKRGKEKKEGREGRAGCRGCRARPTEERGARI